METMREVAGSLFKAARVLRRVARWALLTAGLSLLPATPSFAANAGPAEAKRVLLISTGSRLAPGFLIVDQQILEVFRKMPSPRVDILAENLDIVRFPAERSQRIFTEYLTEKYADFPPDLVILVFVGNVGIPGQVLARVFPDTPIIVAGLTEEPLRRDQFGGFVGGFAQRTDPAATLSLIRRLQPDLRRLVIVAGSSDIDRETLRRVEESAQPFRAEFEIEVWDALGIADLRRAVLNLPPQTALLFTRMFRDGAGQAVISSEVGQWLGRSASAPVYVLSDASFGTGAVGGYVASIEDFGRRAGELARDVLSGHAPEALPFEIRSDSVPMLDWRALKRWGLDESRLPPGSVVRFRPQSIWDTYRWYIVGAIAIFMLQSATIAALMMQRRRLRRAQDLLRDEQELIDFATRAGELGLWARDLDTDEVWVNAPMRSLFDFDGREPLHRDDLIARVHPDDRARVISEVEHSVSAGRPFETEYRVRLSDGSERWLLVKGRTVPGAGGRGNRRMGVVLDTTERKRAERRLREAEDTVRAERAFLREVIDSTPSFIFAKDRAGRFTLANKAVADAYGVTVDALIGHTDADFNRNAEEVSHFRHIDSEVIDSGEDRFIAEERITDAQGNVHWLQTVKRPLKGPAGSVEQVLGASTDITRRRQTEMELQEQRALLAHVGRVSMMGELAASLAHELNQPLTAILSNAKAALRFLNQQHVDLDEVRAALGDIVEANGRAAEVIRSTRGLVKKEKDAEFRPVDLAELVRVVIALVHSDAILHDVRIVLDMEERLPCVAGDPIQLQQVVLNILLNAFDAMKARPRGSRKVEVRLEGAEAGMNRVAIRDSGPGFAGDELNRIFEPFYTTKREGLGMGLPICKSIIEAHRGRLWAENNPDGGATFFFTLPSSLEK
jgi:PAS domain S-box-containing protein